MPLLQSLAAYKGGGPPPDDNRPTPASVKVIAQRARGDKFRPPSDNASHSQSVSPTPRSAGWNAQLRHAPYTAVAPAPRWCGSHKGGTMRVQWSATGTKRVRFGDRCGPRHPLIGERILLSGAASACPRRHAATISGSLQPLFISFFPDREPFPAHLPLPITRSSFSAIRYERPCKQSVQRDSCSLRPRRVGRAVHYATARLLNAAWTLSESVQQLQLSGKARYV